VCSEEVAIVAGGDRVDRVPPLVNALLIPDMPVAVWWVGDLPEENVAYVDSLLEPADRLIVDSSEFSSAPDLELVRRVAHHTTTAPADLNWVRLEEWRVAAAMLFDPPAARARLPQIRAVRVVSCSTEGKPFGDTAESLLFVAWLCVQTGLDARSLAVDIRTEKRPSDHGSLCSVEIEFDDKSVASIARDDERRVLVASFDGMRQTVDCVTRVLSHGVADLIVRLLKRPEADRVYIKALPLAIQLAAR
jgi:glucose-6-phosphate dehydrogenase assembly protein OpcA